MARLPRLAPIVVSLALLALSGTGRADEAEAIRMIEKLVSPAAAAGELIRL